MPEIAPGGRLRFRGAQARPDGPDHPAFMIGGGAKSLVGRCNGLPDLAAELPGCLVTDTQEEMQLASADVGTSGYDDAECLYDLPDRKVGSREGCQRRHREAPATTAAAVASRALIAAERSYAVASAVAAASAIWPDRVLE